jgi:hypothetical protein
VNSTRVTYLVRVSGSAYAESSPAEIQELMDQGLTLDIRIILDVHIMGEK